MKKRFLSPLLLLALWPSSAAAAPYLSEVMHRPAQDRWHGQWIEIINPEAFPIPLSRLSLRSGDRVKKIVPWPSSTPPPGHASAATALGALSLLLIVDRGMTETVAPDLRGISIATTESESLSDGSYLAAGDRLALELDATEVDAVVLGETATAKSWMRLFRAEAPASRIWAASLDTPSPGHSAADDAAYADGTPGQIRFAGGPGPLVVGRPVFSELQCTVSNRWLARQWGGFLGLKLTGNLKLKPLDEQFTALGTDVWPSWPFSLGRSPPFLAVSDTRGLMRLETGLPGEAASLQILFGGYDSPLAGALWLNEVRPNAAQATAFVELCGERPFSGSFSMELWSDDLRSCLRLPFQVPETRLAVLAPSELAGVDALLMPELNPYADGRLVLLDGQRRVIDIALLHKSAWGMESGGSFHRLSPRLLGLERAAWVPSSTTWPPSPGRAETVSDGAALRVDILQRVIPISLAKPFAAIHVLRATELGATLWKSDGRFHAELLPKCQASPGQHLSLNLAPFPGLGSLKPGAHVLVLTAKDLLRGDTETQRQFLELVP